MSPSDTTHGLPIHLLRHYGVVVPELLRCHLGVDSGGANYMGLREIQATILIVNDAQAQLEVISRVLRVCGYNLLTASDGQEGFEVAQRKRPDLVIGDISMPQVDGIEMCRLIRKTPNLDRTPILLVSAHRKDSQSAVAALEAGGDDYLEAPYEAERLVTKVAQLIERRRTETALRKAEERYRSIFENALEGIFQSTPDGRFTSVNPALVQLLGFESSEELIAHQLMMGRQFFVDPSCQKELEGLLTRHGAVVGFKCEVYRKDLSKIWTVQNVRAVRDERGTMLHYDGSIEDITDRKTLEEQLLQSQKMEAIGQLAGGIAHDFNNLLTAINGYSELALQELRAEDPLWRDINEIRKAGERAASLTRQLLAFSRKQVLQPEVLDLNSVVSEMERMLRRLIGEDVELRTVLRPLLGNIKADPGQIEQVIMNLAVNARDAMPAGGTLTIETQGVDLDEEYSMQHVVVKSGHYIMLGVSDTGSGMDEKTQKRIFEPFFTTKGTGKGTGLGLSTVYGIVKQSGGNIWVYSELGRGTTFKIYLPRIDESAPEYKRRIEEGEYFRGTETILLAEDEEMLRKLAREVLERQGYQVLEASNGGSALMTCETYQGPIHLLISDIIMPEMGGSELASRIGQLRPELKVLYISGYTDDTIAHHGILNLEIAFLQKPFTPHELARKVREVLDVT
jgi:two-component system, cell cycle sensor histidine kinase and response regulator CckA